jgi:hypothetical protein
LSTFFFVRATERRYGRTARSIRITLGIVQIWTAERTVCSLGSIISARPSTSNTMARLAWQTLRGS